MKLNILKMYGCIKIVENTFFGSILTSSDIVISFKIFLKTFS